MRAGSALDDPSAITNWCGKDLEQGLKEGKVREQWINDRNSKRGKTLLLPDVLPFGRVNYLTGGHVDVAFAFFIELGRSAKRQHVGVVVIPDYFR